MKTVYTSLPIYRTLAHQLFERSHHAGMDKPVPIHCPRHRLPSFQWKDNGDGATYAAVELVNEGYDGSEEILVTDWVSHTFDTTFNHSGINILQGKNVAAPGYTASSNNFTVEVGDKIILRATVAGASTPNPHLYLHADGGTYSSVYPSDGAWTAFFYVATAGTTYIILNGAGAIDFSMINFSITKVKNIKTLYHHIPAAPFHNAIEINSGYLSYNGDTLNYLLDPGNYYLKITTDNNFIYYSEYFVIDCVFGTDTGLPPAATFSDKFLIMVFSNSCNLGDLLYTTGFEQTVWFISEPMEITFPQEEEGVKNGEGQFVRTFARQTKKYLVRTGTMPDYMVDVFNRMKLHDTIQLIDLVGDVHDVYNLEVEHEWMGEDKYYAKIELTFDYDETVIINASCINSISGSGSITIDSTEITID